MRVALLLLRREDMNFLEQVVQLVVHLVQFFIQLVVHLVQFLIQLVKCFVQLVVHLIELVVDFIGCVEYQAIKTHHCTQKTRCIRSWDKSLDSKSSKRLPKSSNRFTKSFNRSSKTFRGISINCFSCDATSAFLLAYTTLLAILFGVVVYIVLPLYLP
jgi:hypothetical protein